MDAELNKRLEKEHYEKYEEMMNNIGKEYLERLVPFAHHEIMEAYDKDKNLNNLPLAVWDRATYLIPGVSLAEGVCLLKHTAIRMIGE